METIPKDQGFFNTTVYGQTGSTIYILCSIFPMGRLVTLASHRQSKSLSLFFMGENCSSLCMHCTVFDFLVNKRFSQRTRLIFNRDIFNLLTERGAQMCILTVYYWAVNHSAWGTCPRHTWEVSALPPPPPPPPPHPLPPNPNRLFQLAKLIYCMQMFTSSSR